MKLKYNFNTNEIAGKIVAVAVGSDLEKFNGFIKMNENSAFVFNLLKNDVTEDQIIAELVKTFGVEDNEQLRSGVRVFLGQLDKEGVLEND